MQQHLEVLVDTQVPTLHCFSEMSLCGYPLQDLCLQKPFYHEYNKMLKSLHENLQRRPATNALLLAGGLEYEWNEEGTHPVRIYNSIYEFTPGTGLKAIYRKQLLPSYDIFDEAKYFTPGEEAVKIITFAGVAVALTLCEDIWFNHTYKLDPVKNLKQAQMSNEKIDLFLNLSASPFTVDKQNKRVQRLKEISHLLGVPTVYVNQVGAEDEILFDGQSFIQEGDKTLLKLQLFKPDRATWTFTQKTQIQRTMDFTYTTPDTGWEDYAKPSLNFSSPMPTLTPWTEKQCEAVILGLQTGLQAYVQKNKFNNLCVALSGGLDSGLVLALAKLSLSPHQKIHAIYMPGHYSQPLSQKLAELLCEKLHVPLHYLPIKFLHNTAKNQFKEYIGIEINGLTDENIQSRLRGLLLYTYSNQTQSLVINTSNKSELAVGFSTLYGDSVGGVSLLGDVYKTHVFELATFINQKWGSLIPAEMISRPPTAELKALQKDEDRLPPYAVLDPILELILSDNYTLPQIIQLGFSQEMVQSVWKLYLQSEYKRAQFCPILKISPKSFGFGYRIPLCKSHDFYTRI
jgi:NAD+ synthase (glutamine-hydrolysing)